MNPNYGTRLSTHTHTISSCTNSLSFSLLIFLSSALLSVCQLVLEVAGCDCILLVTRFVSLGLRFILVLHSFWPHFRLLLLLLLLFVFGHANLSVCFFIFAGLLLSCIKQNAKSKVQFGCDRRKH